MLTFNKYLFAENQVTKKEITILSQGKEKGGRAGRYFSWNVKIC
jgi:hypothetical protein